MKKTRKKAVDCLMTVLSNWGLTFVFNKSAPPGWGLAEGTSAEGCKVGFADLDRSTPGYRRSLTMTL